MTISNHTNVVRFRETVDKVVTMLTRQGLKVTQSGASAHVTYDHMGKPQTVNIPSIPDDASDEFLSVIRGFIDHQCGHVLETDHAVLKSAHRSDKKSANVAEIVEDMRIEKKMRAMFPGTADNINSTWDYVLNRDTLTKLSKEINPGKRMSILFPAFIQALSGNLSADHFLTKNNLWPELEPLKEKIKDLLPELKSNLENTKDSINLAKKIVKYVEAEETSSSSGEGEESDEESNSEQKSDPDKQKKDKNNKDKDQNKDDKQDNKNKDNKKDKRDKEKEEESKDKADKNKDEKDKNKEEGDSDEDKDSSDSDEDDTDSDKSEDEKENDSQNKDGSETEGDDSDGDSDDDGDEGDDEGDGDESDDEADGDTDKQKLGKSQGKSKGKVGNFDQVLENVEPIDKTLANLIEIDYSMKANASYKPYTQDHDIWTIADPLPEMKEKIIQRAKIFEDRMMSTVGSMAGHIRRMFAQMDFSVNVGGFRTGKLQSSALHRVMQNDNRVFYRREQHTATNTAITLLIDCSGSMSGGRKIDLAVESAMAFSLVLERCGIAHEILGFTTTGYEDHNVWRKISDEISTLHRKGIRFSRVDPINMYVFKTFDETYRDGRLRLPSAVRANNYENSRVVMGANVDGESLLYAFDRLVKRPEERKVLMVFSDGQPASGYGNNSDLKNHLKETVQFIESKKVETIGVGIMTDAVEHYYPKRVVVNDIGELPTKVMRELSTILLKKAR